MRHWSTPILLVLAMILLAYGLATGQPVYPKVKTKPTKIRFAGQVVAVADENNSTLVLMPGPDIWLCVPVGEDRTCKGSNDVATWIASNGEK